MDEKIYLRNLAAASRELHCEIGDIRGKVWGRIAKCDGKGDSLPFGVLFKLDLAAAAIIVIGAGILYSLLSDFNNAVFWHGPLHSLVNSYF